LSTLNARYSHSALGLRYLLANMGELQRQTVIREFTLESNPAEIAEQLLMLEPKVVGLGVYIWNLEQTTRLVGLLKAIAPRVTVVLGGPEVSHEHAAQPIAAKADYLIQGPGELQFPRLCREILLGRGPSRRFFPSKELNPREILFPYACYTDEDIAQRVIYVEASRGCPFKCEFCLSALDKTSRAFDLDAFLAEMARLFERGVRQFKFVDRTFNLAVESSCAILAFFLERLDEELFLHFEVIPDRLPERLKQLLQRFPEGSLQLEVGVQSFNPRVQALISRRQDNARSRENIAWLRRHTQAHLHTDLIIGLPGEDMQSFARGFDELVALQPHEVQVGVLKRLRGAPISRHSEAFDMRYSPTPPYEILSTDRIGFFAMQRMKRFARYWDMVANSGRFRSSLPLILGAEPFERFLALSDWLYDTTRQVHRIALPRLFKLLHRGMLDCLGCAAEQTELLLTEDLQRAGMQGAIAFRKSAPQPVGSPDSNRGRGKKRQRRHTQ